MTVNTLICTLGTSLFKPNLFGLPSMENYQDWLSKQPKQDQQYLSSDLIANLKNAVDNKAWKILAENLVNIPGTTRLCGAEINSITDIIKRQYCEDKCLLLFCHSDTEEGEYIASILRYYYEAKGHQSNLHKIEFLQDKEPKLFRTKGLRNLAKTISRVIYNQGSKYCAINATGGYKAQIAIGVLIGQALSIPVYYKHELFSEIISFPPMPIGLDFNLWLKTNELLTALERWEKIKGIVEKHDIEKMVKLPDEYEKWDERIETLIERIEIDGITYLEISPTGQIFHETFKGRFESVRSQVLPSSVPKIEKQQPRLPRHNWGNAETPILNFINKIVEDCPYVRACYTDYWNPDLPSPVLFHLKGEEIEGIFSNGTWTVKFIVETSATTPEQRDACVADLNHLTEN
jgi:putative CRISPR-associated protein (TIGR02619 family)